MIFLPEKKSFTITIHHKYHVYCANSSLLSSLPQHQQELARVLRQRCCDWPSFVSSYRSVYWYTARIDAASVQLEMPFCNKSQLYKVIRETRGHCTLQSLETRAPIRFVLECFLPCQSLTLRDEGCWPTSARDTVCGTTFRARRNKRSTTQYPWLPPKHVI